MFSSCCFIFFFQGSKVLQNDEFTKDLFRFLQLLCEGHNGGEVLALYTSCWRIVYVIKLKKLKPLWWLENTIFPLARFPELPENPNRKHNHSEHHYQHCGLSAPAAGALSKHFNLAHKRQQVSVRPNIHCLLVQTSGVYQWLLLVLLWQRRDRRHRKGQLLQSSRGGEADIQLAHRVHPGRRWNHSVRRRPILLQSRLIFNEGLFFF